MTDRKFTPTEYLVLEVLAARSRLGESFWTFPSFVRPAVRKLEAQNLVSWRSGPERHTLQVWLTEAGRKEALYENYRSPLENVHRDRLAVTYRTKSGRVLTESDLDALVAEAEDGYDVVRGGPRRR